MHTTPGPEPASRKNGAAGCISLALGGAVAANDGRAAIGPYQSHSRACAERQSKSGLRASRPRAQASVICAMFSAPRMNGWPISRSQRSTMREARSVSCRITPGERSFRGRYSSRSHTARPSIRLRASASRRRASHAGSPAGRAERRLAVESIEVGADDRRFLHADAVVAHQVGNAARRIDLVVRAARRCASAQRRSRPGFPGLFSITTMRAMRAYGEPGVTYSFT